jgi:hypothetical protein
MVTTMLGAACRPVVALSMLFTAIEPLSGPDTAATAAANVTLPASKSFCVRALDTCRYTEQHPNPVLRLAVSLCAKLLLLIGVEVAGLPGLC